MTIIVLLTQAGADLDLAVCEYSNPLVTAAFLQAPLLVRFFLDQGAEPNITCKKQHPVVDFVTCTFTACVRVHVCAFGLMAKALYCC